MKGAREGKLGCGKSEWKIQKKRKWGNKVREETQGAGKKKVSTVIARER